jgi:hypothetical protein
VKGEGEKEERGTRKGARRTGEERERELEGRKGKIAREKMVQAARRPKTLYWDTSTPSLLTLRRSW